jgi:hypothetical protein
MMRVLRDRWSGLDGIRLDDQVPAAAQHFVQCRNCGLTQIQPPVECCEIVT